MAKIFSIINQGYQRLKLAQNRALTNFGLQVFTHNRKQKDIFLKKDISYGKSKLQNFDMLIPKNYASKTLPVVFYVHGGSWCGGDKYGYTMFCSKLARNGYVVINCDYRLMPKVSVKTCVQDVMKAIIFFYKNWQQIFNEYQIDIAPNFDNVFFVGDSAGAHIVSLIAGKQTSQKIRLPIRISALGLYYGVYNFENISRDPSPIMTDLNKYWKSITKDTRTLYKEISTTNYVTTKFPPTFMTSGEIDKLHFQSEVMARLLRYTGIELEYLSFEKSRQDGRHAFLNAPFLKSSKEAFKTLTKFFEKRKVKNDCMN